MRANATLQTQQSTSRFRQHVTLHYYTTDWVDLSSYVWEIQREDEPYGALAKIILSNGSGDLDALDLKDKKIRIGWGADCGVPPEVSYEVSYPPILWGKGQLHTSGDPNEKQYIIVAIGAWNKLKNWTCPDTYDWNMATAPAGQQNKSIKYMISWVCTQAGITLGTSISEDTIIDVWEPIWTMVANQTGLDIVTGLLSLTQCVLVPVGEELLIKYPQDGEAVNYDYYTAAAADQQKFTHAQTQSSRYKPMKVVYKSFIGGVQYSGEYHDDAWDSTMGAEERWDEHGIADSNADCVLLATAAVKRAQGQADAGEIKSSMNCLLELYDQVEIHDTRGVTSGTGRVGGLFYHYYLPRRPNERIIYWCEVRLGGLQRHIADNIEDLLDDFPIGPSIPGGLLNPYSISVDALRQSIQPYDCEIEPDRAHASYTWEQVKWLEGKIHFADGREQVIDAGTLDLTGEGYGDNPVLLYFVDGVTALGHTDDWREAVGRNKDIIAVVQRAEGTTADDKASWDGHKGKAGVLNTRMLVASIILAGHIRAGELILGGKVTGTLDNVSDGSSYGRILLTHLSAGKIQLIAATVVDGGFTIDKVGEGATNKYFSGKDLNDLPDGATYGRVLLTSISAGKIVLAQIDDDATYKKFVATERTKLGGVEAGADVTGTHQSATVAAFTGRDLDDLGDGSTYGKVKQTILAAGWIQVGTGTKDSNLNGFHISDTEIVGQAAGVDQVVMGTDGKIKAGAGAVILGSSGIIINRATDGPTTNFQFQYNGVYKGKMYAGSDLWLESASGRDLIIQAGAQLLLSALPTADPHAVNAVWKDGDNFLRLSAG